MTKEHPILFSTPMIRAILEGRKTQTRRILKKQPIDVMPGVKGSNTFITLETRNPNHGRVVRCRYGDPGDRLWVRETAIYWEGGASGSSDIVYADDKEWSDIERESKHILLKTATKVKSKGVSGRWKKRPSIFMPRWASRITLDIIRVRVQRLQDISGKDILAEGAVLRAHDDQFGHNPVSAFDGKVYLDLISLWAAGWDKINGKTHPWKSNPWVWILEFQKIGVPK